MISVARMPLRPRNVDNQGIILRTSLGFKDFADSVLVQSVCTQTVDGFRRNTDQASLPQNVGCR